MVVTSSDGNDVTIPSPNTGRRKRQTGDDYELSIGTTGGK